MTYLLDVNVLLAAIWNEHPHHQRAFEWIKGKNVAVCPISELGFIRISTNAKSSFNAPMEKTRELLKRFLSERNAARIPADLPALESNPQKSDEVTDSYLAELAARHDMKLATMDGGINHPAAVLL
ncbi:MAG TPA: TA system VapC family ribonuclease toxin [Verrucomicrobiae bacterium]